MSGALLPALGGAMIVAGLIGIVVGFRKVTPRPPGPTRTGTPGRRGGLANRITSMSRTTRIALLAGLAAGLSVALLTGWLIAVPVIPAAVVGLPVLLSTPPSSSRIDRLEAMEEWARSLSSGLTAGRGLDQALIKSLRTTPEPLRPEVSRLVNRLWAHWPTERALRAFAEDLDDATGDLLVANLILGARRRGTGLTSVLDGLAESVAADVRARRQIDADQAKPRATARYVTLFTIGVLGFMALTGEYIEPYGSPLGQVILAVLLSAYVATLAWMRSMATAKPLPRFLNAAQPTGSRRSRGNPTATTPGPGSGAATGRGPGTRGAAPALGRTPVGTTPTAPTAPTAATATTAGLNGKAGTS